MLVGIGVVALAVTGVMMGTETPGTQFRRIWCRPGEGADDHGRRPLDRNLAAIAVTVTTSPARCGS
jgi:hypothetical protein